MNLQFPRNELIHGSKPSLDGLRPGFAAGSKRTGAQVSGTSLCCAQPRAWRLCDGV